MTYFVQRRNVANEIDDAFAQVNSMINSIFKFVNDKEYSVPIIYHEKQKHNFSTRHWQGIVDDNKAILVYDIHGVNPDDIKVKRITEDGVSYIVVEGKTKNEILNCEMDAGNRWVIPYKKFKKPVKEIKNGLLYITIEKDNSKNIDEEEEI
jgi:hypothetical protein